MRVFLLFLSIITFPFLLVFRANAQNDTVLTGNFTNSINYPANGCLYKWTNNTAGIGLPASGTGNINPFLAINNGKNAITATITATPGPAPLVYLTSYDANAVLVLNTVLNKVVDTILVGTHPSGIAISPDGSLAYIANLGSANVSVINTQTDKVIATIAVGNNPYGVSVSHDGNHVYVTNNVSETISVIDSKTNLVIANVPVGISPAGLVESPDGAYIYVANGYSDDVMIISTNQYQLVNAITVGTRPYGLTISPDGAFVYVACTGTNSVSVINTFSQTKIMEIPVGPNPVGITLSPDGTRLYVGNTSNLSTSAHLPPGSVSEINTATNLVTKTYAVGPGPTGISFTPDGNTVYVVCEDGTVTVIDNLKSNILTKITVGGDLNSFGNFMVPGTGCNGAVIVNTITVEPKPITPYIQADSVLGNIIACQGFASSSPNIQEFAVSGFNLKAGIIATAPAGFELALSSNGAYSDAVQIPLSGDSVNKVIVFVRVSDIAAIGDLSGNVVLSSTGVTQSVNVTALVQSSPTLAAIPDQVIESGNKTKSVNITGTNRNFTWTNDRPDIGLAASGTGNIPAFKAINTGTEPIVANITVMPQVSINGYAYIANAGSNSVSVINTATYLVEKEIPVGNLPECVAVSPDGSTVYVSNILSYNVSVINVATNTVVATIPVGSQADQWEPSELAVTPDGSEVYVVNGLQISVINTTTNKVTTSFSTYFKDDIGADGVFFIAFSPDGSKLYLTGNYNNLFVVDTKTKQLITNIIVDQAIGYAAWGIAISPDGKKVYVANTFSNNIAVVDASTYKLITNIPISTGPWGLCLNHDGSRLYAANSGDNSGPLAPGTVSVINTSNYEVITTFPVGTYPIGISITPDDSKVFVANDFGRAQPNTSVLVSGTVSVISTATNTVVATTTVGFNSISIGNFISAGSGCAGLPVTFTITVNPVLTPPPNTNLIIPNTFTPNGDGINDTWDIKYLNSYPNCTVNVYNRYGEVVYSSVGYGVAWDGKFKGSNLPQGTYYYIINLMNGSKVLSGNVTIIR